MVTRLSGGITPGDGSDPRTFPTIWNDTAATIESQGTAVTALQTDVTANGTAITGISARIDDVAFGVQTLGSDTIDIDFSDETPFLTRTVSGTAVAITGSNYTEGFSRTLRMVGGTADASVSVPGDWVFIGNAAGTAITAGATVVIAATSFGTAATDVVATFVESV